MFVYISIDYVSYINRWGIVGLANLIATPAFTAIYSRDIFIEPMKVERY